MIEPKPYDKITTFSRRPAAQQIISYVVFSLQTIIFYSLVLPSYNQTAHLVVFTVLYSFSIVLLMLFTCICSYTDSSDPIMIEYRNGHRQNFQEDKAKEGIILVFCTSCSSYVRQKSRHCRSCDRCAEKFDHHCKWINNCIGSRNYSYFIGMIVTAFLNLIIYIIAVIVLYLEIYFQNFNAKTIVSGFVGIVNAIFAILIANLLVFHFYLYLKDMSTIQYLAHQAAEQRIKTQKVFPQTELNIKQKTQDQNETQKGKNHIASTQSMILNQKVNSQSPPSLAA